MLTTTDLIHDAYKAYVAFVEAHSEMRLLAFTREQFASIMEFQPHLIERWLPGSVIIPRPLSPRHPQLSK